MIFRARLAFLAALVSALLSAAHARPPLGVLDPAARWRVLLAAAGCPPAVAHDLAVRIQRMAGPQPGADQDGAMTAARIAEQITHLAVGRHGLQLTPAQFDAALVVLIGSAEQPRHGIGAISEPACVVGQPSSPAAPSEHGQPFTTKHAQELLREWLPTPGPR